MLAVLGELCALLCGAPWQAQYAASVAAAAAAAPDPGILQAPGALRQRCLALLRDCLERCLGLPPPPLPPGGGGGTASRFVSVSEGLVLDMALPRAPGVGTVPRTPCAALRTPGTPVDAMPEDLGAADARLQRRLKAFSQGLPALNRACGARACSSGAGCAVRIGKAS